MNLLQAEHLLQMSEEKYRRLFETARDGILILDSKTGEITDVNPFLMELLSYPKEELLGKKLWEVGAFKNIKATKKTFKILQELGYARYDDLPLETKDGRLVAVEFVSNSYLAGNERVMQCNIRDISQRKKAEQAEKALDSLEQEKLKTSFIADVTHELRTPLAIIKGNVDLALRDTNTDHNETFKAINVEIDHFTEMLSDLAILTTESQSYHKKIIENKVKMVDVFTKVVKRLNTISATKKVTLVLEKIPNVTILGDMSYLEKLFSNIISNGIFYSKKNGVVTIRGEKQKKHIIISITDKGFGIPKGDIPFIFNRFYRGNNAKTINNSGTGLGLAISKWIAEAHDGDITVTSVLNKGTTFTISLPIIK